MSNIEPRYFDERAESLALMYLTRREDLSISSRKTDADYAVDLLVTIRKGAGYTGRLFGIEVKGAFSGDKSRNGTMDIPIRFTNRQISFYKEMPFPVCLFFFTMENDRGYYKWILEPVIESNKIPTLVLNKSNKSVVLISDEMDKIILKINKWYDKRENTVVPQKREIKIRKTDSEITAKKVRGTRFSPQLIKNLRQRLGITQKELATLTEVTVGAIFRWEKGIFEPRDSKKGILMGLRKLNRQNVKKLVEKKRTK